jgi:hypothetical protein
MEIGLAVLIPCALLLVAAAPNGALEPWGSMTNPTDVARSRTEEITSGRQVYTIVQGGTMDGTNCRSPIGTWQNLEQTWESNRSVRMENVGETDVVDPWLSNGRNDFRSMKEILAGVIRPGMTPREKAVALWWFETSHRFHFPLGDDEAKHPVKVVNCYGYNTCGDDSECLSGLWRAAGLRVRPARLIGHCVSQVFYDGGWHLLDSDMQTIYLLRDNHTIASEREIVRDHDLIRRTHTQGIMQPDDRSSDEWESGIYVYEGDTEATRDAVGTHDMSMVLRPGEALTWRWGHVEPVKYHGTKTAPTEKAGWCFPCVDQICNGLWEYRPDLARDLWRKGADTVRNIVRTQAGLQAAPGTTGAIIWKMASPYVFVGGHVEAEAEGAQFAISWDGSTWEEVGTDLDQEFPHDGPARYAYYLRCELRAGARLRRIAIVNDLQMAPLALPGLRIGENKLTYTDRSDGPREVRITHEWVERSASRPPDAVPAPTFPPDGSEVRGTDIVFRWEEPADPDGEGIADYHFQLSELPGMERPLSGNFWKLISRTADKGKAQYTLPYTGLLSPDTEYYWRVRAKDAGGVWGPWSKTWTFTVSACAPPTDVRVEYDGKSGAGWLTWNANGKGLTPASYRVYASDEKAFTASDEPYKVYVGDSKELTSRFPGNFVGETSETKMPVIGPDVQNPNANKVYYRVVAVDDGGVRSGPSDYAEAPRPIIFSRPVTNATVGTPYSYQLSALRSLGDLRAAGSGDRAPFWSFHDIERPTFALVRGPKWLSIDAESGLLSGTPTQAGSYEVAVRATIERRVRRLDEPMLIRGREKLLEETTERVGTSTQRFVIEVQ